MQLLMVIVRKLFSTKMIALKIWYCVAALFARVNCGSSLELKVCPDSRLTLPCNMTCKTDDFLQTIEFRVNGTLRGSCIGGFGCGAGLQYQGTDTTILTIPSLSYSNDNGNWTCSYSTEVTSAYLTVYGNPSTFNITKTNPDPGAIDVEVVELTARLDCAYPSAPSVILEFRETTKENYQTINSLNQPNSSVPSPGQCGSDTDKIVIANLKASYDYSDHKFAGKTGYLRVKFSYSTVVEFITSEVGPYTFKGSTTTESTINLSTDPGTTTMSETSKMSTESLSPTQWSVSLSESTPEGNTPSGSIESVVTKSETSTAPVTTSPSGLSEEMIIITSVVSAVGGVLLIVIIVIVVLCCKRRTSTANKKNLKNKHDKLHVKTWKNKDLNSNYDRTQKNKYSAQSRRNLLGDTNLYQKHSQKDILYGGRMPPGIEFQRPKNYYQQNYFSGNQHHYRKQNNVYYLPYTDPRNVMHYQRYPESGYNEDMLGYSRAGPYRMQQFYPKSYARYDSYTDYELERRIGHARGQYESYWDDTLY